MFIQCNCGHEIVHPDIKSLSFYSSHECEDYIYAELVLVCPKCFEIHHTGVPN
jgi:hypothetical protein